MTDVPLGRASAQRLLLAHRRPDLERVHRFLDVVHPNHRGPPLHRQQGRRHTGRLPLVRFGRLPFLVQQAVQETARAVAAVDAVSADMNLIEVGSQETDEMLRRISAALEEQSRAVDEINANLTSVDMIARGNASATEEITASVMELSRIAESTRLEVDRFQTA